MKLTVQYYGQIGQAVECAQEMVDCPKATSLPQLLATLADRHGESLRSFLFNPEGLPSKSLLITVNNSMVGAESKPVLQAGDEVALLPPIAGG